MIYGLDTLRVFALLLITWQHAASSIGLYELTQWRNISPGQVGVSIFCAISGLLAFRGMPIKADKWIVSRVIRIFPAYWIVTIGAFILTIIAGGKNVTLGLFVSQMLGLGYFTHGWELVNVVSWYLSLLILCYAIFIFSSQMKHQLRFNVFLISVCFMLIVTRTEVDISRHIPAFFLGGMLCWAAIRKEIVLMAVTLVCLGLAYDSQLFYSGFAILVLAFVTSINKRDYFIFHIFSRYSYEYFLVHGIFLVGCLRFFSDQALAISLAIIFAMISAIALNRLVSRNMIPKKFLTN